MSLPIPKCDTREHTGLEGHGEIRLPIRPNNPNGAMPLWLAILASAACLIALLLGDSTGQPVSASAPGAVGTLTPQSYLPLIIKGGNTSTPIPPTSTPTASPSIYSVTDNRSSYPNSQIPRYEKLEITFQLNTAAQNLQMPYDPSPPQGVTPGMGVTVNALFTSPSGHVYTQPAFYYQDFDYQVKSGREWMYPNGNFFWKVRFAPDEPGTWQYKLTAQDVSGATQSASSNFSVTSSSNHGFVKVGQNDPRYFEFDDGSYFPGLGYNMNYNAIDWINPVLSNQTNFQIMGQNGIQLVRMWLSQWSIWGSAWNPWYGIRNDYDGYIPRTGLITYGSSDPVSAQLVLVYSEDSSGNQNSGSWFDACRFIGGFQAPPAVKENAKYHIRIRFNAFDVTGPRVGSYPDYGFVAKVQNPNDGNWHTHCYNPGQPTNGVVVSGYGHDSANWTYLDGTWNSGGNDFLPVFYLVLENVNSINPATGNHPYVYIDTVSIQEDLGGGSYGPNIVTKPSMEHEKYFMDRNAYAFDKVVDLAKQNNVYLRPVIMEKNEQIENEIGYDGNRANFDNNNFYGNYRTVTAVRWYQTAWWRYLQARWGYSTNIQSWELLNEGDPWNDHHYTLADEFGKYMHQFGPDSHLVSTSNWNSFPATQFWGNASYPNVDFADLHQYIPLASDPTHFYDTAAATYDVSMLYGAKQSGGAGKPTIRGETGLTDSGTQPPTQAVLADTQGIWLHNFVWGEINPGGMLESYWYSTAHIYTSTFDHRNEYGNFYRFISGVPLNNGDYQDAQAAASDPNLRAWGQKDLVNDRAIVWIANKNHTWQNVVNKATIAPITGTVTLAGFAHNTQYSLQWWNTYSGSIASSQNVTSDAAGNIKLTVQNLSDDTAVRIGF
jgi:Domain of unknown function (DUF5060)